MKTRVLLLALLLGLAVSALAGEVAVNFVKSLGALSPNGAPLPTMVGHLAIDAEGNLFCGTPGGGSTLLKLSPDGGVIWQNPQNFPGFQGVTIDKDYVYTCGMGFYGYRQVKRWSRASGAVAEGWQHEWKDATTPDNGVKPFVYPCALTADDNYLYITDNGGDELRRIDKKTGQEKPFAAPIKVVKPIDIAWAKNGNLLVLTATAVAELTKDGEPVNLPLIKGIKNASAIAVQPGTGNIFLGVGGDEAELVNRVMAWTPGGELIDDVEIGAGGDFQGKWSPRAFAFSAGSGALAFDPQGGLWVNPGWSHRMWLLTTLEHFAPGDFKNDRTLSGLTVMPGYMETMPLAVDEALNVYVHGQVKLTWDNKVLWTSGLVPSGDTKQYPVAPPFWPTAPLVAGGKMAVLVGAGNSMYTLNPDRGNVAGKGLSPALPEGGPSSACTAGGSIYLARAKDGALFQTSFELATPELIFTPPAEDKVANANIVVSPGADRFYYQFGGKIVCYTKDGKKQWETPSGFYLAGISQGMLFATRANWEPGVMALDEQTGDQLAIIGDKPVDERPALARPQGLAVGEKDGRHYLFAAGAGRIQVYRFERADWEE